MDLTDNDDKDKISLNTMCKQAFYDAAHDFDSEIAEDKILEYVEKLTPCIKDTGKKKLYEDDFLKKILLEPVAPSDVLNSLKKIDKPSNPDDVVKNISDTIPWSDFIKENYNVYSAYRPSFSRPCDGVDFKKENKDKTYEETIKIVVEKCATIPLVETEEYWKTSYIQNILETQGIQNDVFFICDTTKGNIKQDLYFVDPLKNQTFYWLQTPQTIFDPASKTAWNTDPALFERPNFKFAWQTAIPGAKRNYLYPEWDKQNNIYQTFINRDNIEKLICSNTNSHMITTTDSGKELLPTEHNVSFYIQQIDDKNKYVYANNKSSAKSSINNVGKSSNSDYIDLAQRYIAELIKHIITPSLFNQQNTQQFIAQYTEPYMLMAKRYGDASQAAACCQASIPFNEPNDTVYVKPSPRILKEQHIDKNIKMSNGNHALISYDRICVATGLIFLAPIVIYSLDGGFIVFTKKILSSIDTRINSFFDNSELKCKRLLNEKRDMLIRTVSKIKSKKISNEKQEYTISEIKEKIKNICDVKVNKALTVLQKTAHIPNWLRPVKNKKTNTYLKQHNDVKKSKNESFRLFIGLIMSLSKYLLDLQELENNYAEFENFLNRKFEISGFDFTKRIQEINDQYGQQMTEEEKKEYLKKITELDNSISVFIKETEDVKKKSNFLIDTIESIGLLKPMDSDEDKIEFLIKILPQNFNHNMNHFDLYESMQSRLSVRTIVSSVRSIFKGKRDLSETDKKMKSVEDINDINLTEINKTLGLDTFTLAAWRELKKTNYTELIELFKERAIDFYESVFSEQYKSSIIKFTNRQLEKKSAAQDGINILRREFGIQPLQSGGDDDSRLQKAKKNNTLKSITSRLYPILLYEFITNNAKNDQIDSFLFSYENDKGISQSITTRYLIGYLNKFIFTNKNISVSDFYNYNLYDNTPFVYDLIEIEKRVDSKGYIYLPSPMYTFDDGSEILEEIFVGKDKANINIKVPMYIIFKHIPKNLYQQSEPTSFIEFSYTLPRSYYDIEDNFDTTFIEEDLNIVRDILKLTRENIVNYQTQDKVEILKEILVSIYDKLYEKRMEFTEDINKRNENRNIHRIFVEENQLSDTYPSIEDAINNNDIPAVLNRYFTLKNEYDIIEEFSNEFKREIENFILELNAIEIDDTFIDYRYLEQVGVERGVERGVARGVSTGVRKTQDKAISEKLIIDPKQSLQKRQDLFKRRREIKSQALRTTRRLQRQKQNAGNKKTRKLRSKN